jgi:hypothetical protein
MFAPEDLDDFLTRLGAGAAEVAAVGPNQSDIPTIAKKACCGTAEIVQAILDGRLVPKGRLASERGFMAVLLDLDEVRTLFRGAELDGLTALALAKRLGVADRVTARLIGGGYLRTVTAINPINRCPTVIVPTEEVERFEREFVSLFSLAKQRGAHFRVLKKALEAAGVRTAFDPDEVGPTFYRRSQIEGAKTQKGKAR